VNIKSFFAEALGQALDLGIGTPDDVLKHVTPDLLAEHLPRPLWARLLTACLGAPRVDAQLVIETIGVPNLCEHIPANAMWSVICDIAARALGQAALPAPQPVPVAVVAQKSAPTVQAPVEKRSVLAPPPDAIEKPTATQITPVGPSIPSPVNEPLADLITELEADERPITPTRARTPTAQRFRQSNTGIGLRGGGNSTANQPRRPQAQAVVPQPSPAARAANARRGSTEVEEVETDASQWRASQGDIPVDDSQLVDWQSTETTQASGDEDFSDIGRKR
jgi:hypothetical protein